jgi:FdhD protein
MAKRSARRGRRERGDGVAAQPIQPPEALGARKVVVERAGGSAASEPAAAAELDWVAVEEPLEILVERRPFAVTLRTPGHDRELTLGFLIAEGVIECAADVATLHGAGVGAAGRGDRVEVTLEAPALDRWARRRVERELRITSACGACGKPSLEELWASAEDLEVEPLRWDPAIVPELLGTMRSRQTLFERTGGLHAAAAFDAAGACFGVFEDVGRHNAVDKLVGSLAARTRPLRDRILVVSGRAGFEIVQKAAAAGGPALVSVGAASSLAVELAARAGVELWCFAGSPGAHRHRASRPAILDSHSDRARARSTRSRRRS